MCSILIIEQDREITALLVDVLSGDGRRVMAVPTGHDGLRLLARDRFDVVIADITAPRFSGFATVMEINCLQPRPRIIAMTGYNGQDCRTNQERIAAALNVQCLLYKPFPMVELLAAVFPETAVLRDEPHYRSVA